MLSLNPQVSQVQSPAGSGVAMGWTEVDMSTPLLPEVIPEIDANPMTFLGGVGEGG